MAVVRIDSRSIYDWVSFHKTCRIAFGFPDFYGMNLNAFIDCLSYIDEGDGMSKIVLEPNEVLRIEVLESENFKSRLPEVFEGFVDSVDFVNRRFVEDGKEEKIDLVML